MPMKTRTLRRSLFVGLASFSLVLAACGSDDEGGAETTEGASDTATGGSAAAGADISGKTIRMSGSEVGVEADGVAGAFAKFEQDTGATVEFTGTRDFETQIRVAAEGGDLPDLAFFPQPALLKALADNVTPLTDETAAVVQEDYDPYWSELVTSDTGEILGIPAKADLKSLVWYSPKAFTDGGYTVPETWDDLIATQDKMKADGKAPWCVGIESGEATGWPFTDWVEDVMLRLNGPDVYDQWVNHEIPFNDPKVKAAVEMVGEIWFPDGNVANGRTSIASSGFASAGLGVADGSCMMYRQGNFFAVNFKDANPNLTFGEEGDVNAFYLPTMNDDFGKVTLSAGIYAAAFNDKPETQALMAYIASADYTNERITAQGTGFLNANKKQDLSLYPDELDRTFGQILVDADPVRFDASDLMPPEVGSGSFWKEGTNFVAGTTDVDAFLDAVEASWPKN